MELAGGESIRDLEAQIYHDPCLEWLFSGRPNRVCQPPNPHGCTLVIDVNNSGDGRVQYVSE